MTDHRLMVVQVASMTVDVVTFGLVVTAGALAIFIAHKMRRR